jgi:hypothetical protein
MKPPICNGFEMIVPLLFKHPPTILFQGKFTKKPKGMNAGRAIQRQGQIPILKKLPLALTPPIGKTAE